MQKNEESIADWERIYRSLTDPEEREKSKRKEERKKRMEERKADTGII